MRVNNYSLLDEALTQIIVPAFTFVFFPAGK